MKTNLMKKLVILVMAASMLLCAFGASAEEGVGTFGLKPFSERQSLRIGYLAGALNPYIIANELGVFDALNVDVEFICFSGGPAEMEANSEWDIATAGGGGLCIGTTAYDMRIIDIMDYEDYNSLWARADSPLAQDRTNPENWKVEWIYAAGTTCQAVLACGLESVGLSFEDITSINVDLQTTYTAFNSGTADAMATNPFQSTYANRDGYVLIGNGETFGFCAPSGTVASKKILDEKMDLVATVVAAAHLTNDWIFSSEENLSKAAGWFYKNCQEEGYNCDEDTAAALTEWYHGPTTAKWISSFTETAPDDAGIYTSRVDRVINFQKESVAEVLKGELFDVVADVVGKSSILIEGSHYCKCCGVVGSVGVLKKDDICLNMEGFKNSVRLQMLNFPYHSFASFDRLQDMIRRGLVHPKDFYSHVIPVEKIQEALELVRTKKAIKVILKF